MRKKFLATFDEYIHKYKEIKPISKGEITDRELAKLFLDNLYDKIADIKDDK